MKHAIIKMVFFLAAIHLSSGCALNLVEGLMIEEAAAATGLAESEMAMLAAGERIILEDIAVTSGRLNAALADVRLLEAAGERPLLYIRTPSGIKKIAELYEPTMLRVLQTRQFQRIPGEIYKVRGNLVNVRSSRILSQDVYNVKYKINEGQPVLVLSEREGWYTVWLGENKVGYVKDGMNLLAPVLAATAFNSLNSHITFVSCNVCNGYGSVYKNLTCPSCKGATKFTCGNCHGNAKFTCSNCAGKTKFVCGNCHGDTRFICNNCHGDTKFKCSGCGGKGVVKCGACRGKRITFYGGKLQLCSSCSGSGKCACYTCNQTGNIPCYTCNQSGYTPCYTCNQSGNIPCYTCNQTGYTPCYTCNQSGNTPCYTCNQIGNLNTQVLCSGCLGTGRIVAKN